MARQRGRKSAASHAIAPAVAVFNRRIRPRAEDPASVQAVVAELIAAADADHFREVDWPILTSYGQAILLEREAYARLAMEGVVLSGKTNPWLVVAEKAGRQIIACSMRLRLAPQSRLEAKAAARKPGKGVAKPWDDYDAAA